MKQIPIEDLDCIDLVNRTLKHGIWIFRDQFPNIILDDRSTEALCNILGMIHGVWIYDTGRAQSLAKDFMRTIDMVSRFEMMKRTPDEPDIVLKAYSRMVTLSRDGYMSLSFCTWNFVPFSDIQDRIKVGMDNSRIRMMDDHGNTFSIEDAKTWKDNYCFSYNGGIIFRAGEWHGEEFTLNPHHKDCRAWSVHT